MKTLPDSIADDIQNYEATIEPGHLTLIISTTSGDLQTFTFAVSDGKLSLESQTENGASVDTGVPEEVEILLDEHPVLSADEVND